MLKFKTLLLLTVLSSLATVQAIEIDLYNSLENMEDPNAIAVKSIELNMARGEYESFQILLSGGTGKVNLSSDVNSDTIKFTARQIESIDRIHTEKVWDEAIAAQTDQQPATVTPGDKWYDPLVRYKEFHFDSDGKLRLWITCAVDANANPSKNIQMTLVISSGREKLKVPIKLNIYNVTIPLAHSVPSVFGLSNKIMAKDFGIADNQKRRDIQYKWINELLDYRMDPYVCDWGATEIEGKRHTLHAAYSSPYPADDSRTISLFKDERFSKVALPYVLLSDDYHKLTTLDDKQLVNWVKALRKHNLQDKAYYYYWDEPMHMDQYRKIGNIADRLSFVAPDVDILTTFFCGPKDGACKDDLYTVFKLWAGDTNLYCMSTWALKGIEANADKCLELVKDGEEWWVYICCGPGKPHPNLFLDMTGFNHRAVMWRVWKQRAQGFLYWALNSCQIKDDKLILRKGLPQGDGLLIYPGSLWGQDVSEMVASVRLERYRDSFEDYELLQLLTEKKDRDAALAHLAKIYTGPAKYTKSSTAVEAFKKEILTELESLNNESKG